MVVTPNAIPDGFTEDFVEADSFRIRYVSGGEGEPIVYLCGGGGLEPGPAFELPAAVASIGLDRYSGLGLPLELGRRSRELFAAEVLPAVRTFSDDMVPA